MKQPSVYVKMRVLGAIDTALGRTRHERIHHVAALFAPYKPPRCPPRVYGCGLSLPRDSAFSRLPLTVAPGAQLVVRNEYEIGGCAELWSNLSAEAEVFGLRHTFGAAADYKKSGREPVDYVNSRFILMWGWSPGDGHFGTGTLQYLKWAKQHGVRILCVDPRVTTTSRQLAARCVPTLSSRKGIVLTRSASGSFGSPRTRSPMMFFCTSSLPP